MTHKSITEIVAKIIEELTPLSSDDRLRAVQASLTLLGEVQLKSPSGARVAPDGEHLEKASDVPVRAQTWMKQNGLSMEQLSQVFHFDADGVEVIASEMPGKNKRELVRNAYVLLGIARLLSSGEARFDDKAARALCEVSGIYDHTNHMKYMKGNEFTGNKDKGWVLTAPGLKHAAILVKALSQ